MSLLFVDDRAMGELNRRYLNRRGPTDVLAFPMGDEGCLLGDVVISVERAAAQAQRAGHSLEMELDVLLIHGLLHLMGYDHERSRKEAESMRREERELLFAVRGT